MMRCKNCGSEVEGASCPVCGKPVRREEPEPNADSVLFSKGYVNPFAPKDNYMGPLPSPGGKKSKYLAPVIALVIILLAVLGGLLLSLFSKL